MPIGTDGCMVGFTIQCGCKPKRKHSTCTGKKLEKCSSIQSHPPFNITNCFANTMATRIIYCISGKF